jgi:hypothetical protein
MPCQENVSSIICTSYDSSFSQLQQLIKSEATSISFAVDLWKAKNHQGHFWIKNLNYMKSPLKMC